MSMYAQVEVATDRVIKAVGRLEPPDFAGPPDPPPAAEDGIAYHLMTAPLPQGRLSETAELKWNNGAPQWVETAPLADAVAAARARIDAKADSARKSILIVDTKDLEYVRARDVAQPFKDAGYTPPVPDAVQSWADAKKWRNGGVPWTAQQAADDILAQAGQYNYLLDGIRRLRLDAMEHCLAIGEDPNGTHAQVKAIEDQFYLDLKTLMGAS